MKKIYKYLASKQKRTLMVSVFIVSILGCQKTEVLEQQESYVFGTRVVLSSYTKSSALAKTVQSKFLQQLDVLHRRLHPWDTQSEIVQFNRAISHQQTFSVAPDVLALLRLAQGYEQKSKAYFNPAIGQMINIWGFHQETFDSKLPNPQDLQNILSQRVSMQDLNLDEKLISSRNPYVQVDLGGVAKGWALDLGYQLFLAEKLSASLLNIGGNIRVLGSKPNMQEWTVGIQHPRLAEVLASVKLYDGESIGTSGDYQRYFEYKGQRFCHLINPKTGSALCEKQSLTLIIPNRENSGLESDVYSKILYFSPIEQVMSEARRLKIESVLLVDQKGRVWVSDSMLKRLKWEYGPKVYYRLPEAK